MILPQKWTFTVRFFSGEAGRLGEEGGCYLSDRNLDKLEALEREAGISQISYPAASGHGDNLQDAPVGTPPAPQEEEFTPAELAAMRQIIAKAKEFEPIYLAMQAKAEEFEALLAKITKKDKRQGDD